MNTNVIILKTVKKKMEYYLIEQEDFEDVISDIQNNKADKNEILKFSSFLENKLKESSYSASEIKSLTKSDADYYVHEQVLYSMINDFNKIHTIDSFIFKKILNDSGFTEDQTKAFETVLNNNNDTFSEVSNLLIDSELKGINVLQNPNSKNIVTKKTYVSIEENLYTELLEYIVDNFAPSQKMEYLAKMSILQKTGVFNDICKDKNFEKIISKVKDKKILSNEEKDFINSKIEDGLNSITQVCPTIKNNEGYKSLNFKRIFNNSHKKIAGRGHPDAYGIHDQTLTIATVTSNINFENQNNQSIIWANAIENSLELNENKGYGFSRYNVIIACNPIINENNEKGSQFKKFQKELKNLSNDNILKSSEIDSLKRMSVDVEMLSILVNYSELNYEKIRKNLEFYVLGENFTIKPKEYKEQYLESIKNINVVTNSIIKIIDNNPELFLINTALKNLVESSVPAIRHAKSNFLNSLNEDGSENENRTINNSTSDNLSKIRKALIKAGNDSYKKIDMLIFSNPDNESLTKSHQDLKDGYITEQEKIKNTKNNTVQNKEYNQNVRYIKSNSQCIDFSDPYSQSTASKISSIFNGIYNFGRLPTEETLNKALNIQLMLMEERYHKSRNRSFHVSSIRLLATGLKRAINSGLPYDLDKSYKKILKIGKNLPNEVKNFMNDEQIEKFDENIQRLSQKKNNLKPQ